MSEAETALTRTDLETVERFAENAANMLAANPDQPHVLIEPSAPFHRILSALLEHPPPPSAPIRVTQSLLNVIATKAHGRLLLARREDT